MIIMRLWFRFLNPSRNDTMKFTREDHKCLSMFRKVRELVEVKGIIKAAYRGTHQQVGDHSQFETFLCILPCLIVCDRNQHILWIAYGQISKMRKTQMFQESVNVYT